MKKRDNSVLSQFGGTKKVFSFTLTQFFKNKANLISFIVIFVMCLLSVPLTSLATGSGDNTANIYDNLGELPPRVYIYNTTGIDLTEENEIISSSPFSSCKFINVTRVDGLSMENNEALVQLHFNQSSYCFEIFMEITKDSILDNNTLSALQYTVYEGFELAKYSLLGMDSDTAISILQSGYLGNVDHIENFNNNNQNFEVRYTVQMIYSIVILMLCTLASSYIIRTIVEEKSSKLVELLLVSVRPLALLAGKILAIMLCVLSMIGLMVLGVVISNYISTEYLGLGGLTDTLTSMGVSFDLLNLGWELALIVIVSVILSYITFSLISGISGACCTSMDEMSSASLLAIIPAMIGYMSAPILSAFENTTLDIIASLLPIISSFYAPSAYLLGNISIGVMLISLVIQAATAFVLALFCRRVYSYIIMYKGNRLNLKALFAIAGKESDK